MSTHLRISTSHADGATVVHVGGEVDLASAPELEAAVAAAFELAPRGAEDARVRHELVLDLRGVTFLAAAGLAELLKGARLAGDRGLRVRVIASDGVLRAVEAAAVAPATLGLVPATAWRAARDSEI